MCKEVTKPLERNTGIDLCKMLGMFMIVIEHIILHGGIQAKVAIFSGDYYVAWLLRAFCICAVDVYAICTGYLMYNKKFRFGRMLDIWIEIWIYSVGAYLFTFFAGGHAFLMREALSAAMPILSKQYWYTTIYFALMFFTPFINRFIEQATKKQDIVFVTLLICTFSIIPTILNFDLFETPDGSFTWMMVCYVLGAELRKYSLQIRPFISGGSFFISIVVMACSKFFLDYISYHYNHFTGRGEWLITKRSFLAVIAAVSVVQFCTALRHIKLKKIIQIMGANSLAVYLIHDNNYFREMFFWGGKVDIFIGNVMLLKVLGLAIVIFVSCVLVELLRKRFLKRILERVHKKEFLIDRIYYQ